MMSETMADPNKETRLRFKLLSIQQESSDVEELRGGTCERLLAVAGDREGTLLLFYLRVEGTWFRGFLDEGVFFLAVAHPDPVDDLEAGEEYLDLGELLGVKGARVRSLVMDAGVLRAEFEVGEPMVLLWEGGQTRWEKPGAEKSRGFAVLRDRGASPRTACRIASTWELCEVQRIRMLRLIYGLSLRDAKEVLLVEAGTATSLDEHEARVAAELAAASAKELRELFGGELELEKSLRRTTKNSSSQDP